LLRPGVVYGESGARGKRSKRIAVRRSCIRMLCGALAQPVKEGSFSLLQSPRASAI
jgi:hypothetical protein